MCTGCSRFFPCFWLYFVYVIGYEPLLIVYVVEEAGTGL
jgi:hypothetical protein